MGKLNDLLDLESPITDSGKSPKQIMKEVFESLEEWSEVMKASNKIQIEFAEILKERNEYEKIKRKIEFKNPILSKEHTLILADKLNKTNLKESIKEIKLDDK